jgi:hypothetical protein
VKIGLRLSLASAAALLAVTVAGCDSATEGQPRPEDEVTSTQTSSAEPTPEGPTSLSNTQLCALLTSEEAQSLGTSPTGEAGFSIADGSPQCEWTAATGLTVVFQQGKQSKNTQAEPNITVTPTTIAGLSAVESHWVEPNIDFCQYMVDVTDNAMISGGATVNDSGEGANTSCEVAKQFIEIIIPKALDR